MVFYSKYLPVIPCFYEIPVDIRAIFLEYRKLPKNTRISPVFPKKHCITVLSYNYLIFSLHDVFNRRE